MHSVTKIGIVTLLCLASIAAAAQVRPYPEMPSLEAEREELCDWAARQIANAVQAHSQLLKRLAACLEIRPLPNCPPSITRDLGDYRARLIESDQIRRALSCPLP